MGVPCDHFRKDQPENLLVLCPNHHREYDDGMIAIVPSPEVRRVLIQREHEDFERRRIEVQSGRPDPGRTLPHQGELSPGFEYVPIHVGLYLEVHNGTAQAPGTYFFDSQGYLNRTQSPHSLFPYPLLIAAYQALFHPLAVRSERTDAARVEVKELVDLYSRYLSPVNLNRWVVANSAKVRGAFDQAQSYISRMQMPSVPENPQGVGGSAGQPMNDDLGLGSSGREASDSNQAQLDIPAPPMPAILSDYQAAAKLGGQPITEELSPESSIHTPSNPYQAQLNLSLAPAPIILDDYQATAHLSGQPRAEDLSPGSSVQTPSERSEGGYEEYGGVVMASASDYGDGYPDEPIATPSVLSSRLSQVPAKLHRESLSSLRFATSSGFITNSELDGQ